MRRLRTVAAWPVLSSTACSPSTRDRGRASVGVGVQASARARANAARMLMLSSAGWRRCWRWCRCEVTCSHSRSESTLSIQQKRQVAAGGMWQQGWYKVKL